MMSSQDLDSLKKAAALTAVEFVRDGMVVGLGTGSTAKHLVIALGERVRAGMTLRGVPTSKETATLARQQGIILIDADDVWVIDVAIDGADQVDPGFNLIKGGGGAPEGKDCRGLGQAVHRLGRPYQTSSRSGGIIPAPN
jgi:ribose 5-phosphate isomerase A